MNKLAAIVVLVIIVAAVGAAWKFGLLPLPKTSTTTTTTTSVSTTTTMTTVNTTTTTSIQVVYYPPCSSFGVNTSAYNAIVTGKCSWSGGELGVWAAAGGHGPVTVEVTGSNGDTYVDTSFDYNCTTFVRNFSAPRQNLTLTLETAIGSNTIGTGGSNSSSSGTKSSGGGAPTTGSGQGGSTATAKNASGHTPAGGACSEALLKLNETLVPPPFVVYQNVYNGNFSQGWTGWNVSGPGFRNPGFAGPMNITWANDQGCWLSVPWNTSMYSGNFFATSFTCGTSESAGNVTSSWFNVTKPFLNFKLVSSDNSNLYIQVMRNSTNYINAYFDTLNVSTFAAKYQVKGADNSIKTYYNVTIGPTTFRNASIPLACFFGEPVRIRLVAATSDVESYIAAGDFTTANIRSMAPGILVGLNFSHATCV